MHSADVNVDLAALRSSAATVREIAFAAHTVWLVSRSV